MIKNSKVIIWGLALTLLISPGLLFAELSKNNKGNTFKENTPLLLTSGQTGAETSEIRYILWTDNASELSDLDEVINKSSYTWQKDIICDFNGNKIYKYIREEIVDKNQEHNIIENLNILEDQIQGKNIYLYFQQRINQNLDLESYLTAAGINRVQKVETNKIISITGYSDDISKNIRSGNTEINIQVLTRTSESAGKTILAVPALLEEF